VITASIRTENWIRGLHYTK